MTTALLDAARTQVGYVARPQRENRYGLAVGYDGIDHWDGIFIDWCARQKGLVLPSHIYSPVALAEYLRTGAVRVKPKAGDIVFFSFPEQASQGAPHVGIVSEVGTEGRFSAIEAQVTSGLPLDTSGARGVYERQRFATDVLAFARPVPLNTEKRPAKAEVMQAHLTTRKKHPSVVTVQLALSETVGLRGYERGMFDGATRSAYARWQAVTGEVGQNVDGVPDVSSLELLGQISGLFTVRE